jgi:UPF0716 family protein affecting phage T7 exclusion
MTCPWYATPLGGCYVTRPARDRARGTAPTARAVRAWLRRTARRTLVAVAGGAAVLAGVVMLVTPGPGLVTVVLGFGMLGREFAWAARVNTRARDRLARATRGAGRTWSARAPGGVGEGQGRRSR